MDKKTIQIPVMLDKEEEKILNELVDKMKGTRAQIFRLALSKFYEQNKFNNLFENGTTNTTN